MQAKHAEACELAGWMAAFGRMNGQLLNAIESLRALACRNPQFDNAETQLTDSQQKWRERVIADCEARSAGLMVAVAKQSRFMACDTARTSDRAEALGRYVAALKAVQAAPGTKQIGGGCYHVCARHGLRGTPWEAPAEAAACTTR